MVKRCGWLVLLGALACSSGPKKPELLKPFCTVDVPAVSRFVTAEHFVVSHPSEETIKGPEGVWIISVDPSFQAAFSKPEENVPAATLSAYTVVRISKNQLIVDELGDRAETSLAHLWALLERQPHGPSSDDGGALYIPEWAKPGRTFKPPEVIKMDPLNVFFIRDVRGKLRAVQVSWYVDPFRPYTTIGWVISIGELGTEPGPASVSDKDFRVFSR